MSNDQEILDIKGNQFEADTVMLSILQYPFNWQRCSGSNNATDTDCYAQAAAISK